MKRDVVHTCYGCPYYYTSKGGEYPTIHCGQDHFKCPYYWGEGEPLGRKAENVKRANRKGECGMTENEAVAKIKYRIETASSIAGRGVDGRTFEDLDIAISALEEIQQYRALGTAEELRDAVEKQMAKKPIFHEERHEQHSWEKDDDGEIDVFAMSNEYHNGPRCEFCGYSFCVHCHPEGYDDKNCYKKWHSCPTCGNNLSEINTYCEKCGQKIDWAAHE